ncbi:hypothetical protein NQ315_014387 [Exocentrus adspersus]|uniref:Uncharacterized protein n=1 Tax=Exocentrus adspersus TaxID=1586481 RepID=A0AAV8VF21_9CUCU|nr:hypothetical protein NQ315_014387 [Exocentrus adspersus]
MSSDEELMDCTPPEIRQAADAAVHNLVPEKSKHRYLKAIELYRKWCEEKKVKNTSSESVLLTKEAIHFVVYSMIRTILQIVEKTDISKHGKLLAFLKRQNVGFRPKKSNIFSRKNKEDFLNKAPNNLLPIKIRYLSSLNKRIWSLSDGRISENENVGCCFFEEQISVEIPDSKTHIKDSKGFTGHALRRTAATLLANSGANVLQLKRLGG